MPKNQYEREANFRILERNIRQILAIAQRLEYESEKQKEWEAQSKKIQDLLQNKTYKIAVIGELKTGKSSFLNAMIGDPNLLKIKKAVPTTSAVTYLKYGEVLDVEFLLDGKCYSFKKDQAKILPLFQKFKDVFRFWENKEERFDRKMQKFIEAITTTKGDQDYDMSSQIQKIHVIHPSSWLKQGLIFLDTPGTNIENKNRNHLEATEDACKDADACVLLFSAGQLGKNSYFEFIKKHISTTILKKFFFVINKIDAAIEEQESVESLIKLLQTKIKKELPRFPLDQMKIYPFSSKKILEGLEDKIFEEELQVYQRMQQDFEQDLRYFMEIEREILLQTKACEMERSICEENNKQICLLRQQYKKNLEELEQKRLPHLQGFIESQRKKLSGLCYDAIQKFQKEVRTRFNDEKQEIYNYIKMLIYNAQSVEHLKIALNQDIRNYLMNTLNYRFNNFEIFTNKKFAELFQNIARFFHGQFENMYSSLGRWNPVGFVPDYENFFRFQSQVNTYLPVQSILDGLPTDGDIAIGAGVGLLGGAAAGAVAGSFFPGIGTLVGGIIGGVVGAVGGGCAASGPSLEKIKTDIWNKSHSHLSNEFSRYSSEIKQRFEKQEQDFQSFMSRLIQSYSEKYQAIIEKAIEEHKRQEKQTKARIEELEEFNISLGIIDQALMNLSQELDIELKESRRSG